MTKKYPKPIMTDRNGDQWWNWIFTYHFEGDEYGFSISARSKEEAKSRLKRLPMSRYVGQQHGHSIPAIPMSGLYVRLKTWILKSVTR